MSPVLILLIFLLQSGAGAEEIIGGHEVKPHSRPYMAFIQFVCDDVDICCCGGFLVRDDFVLTAAHCLGSSSQVSMKVTLGAHDVTTQEKTQQIIPVAKAIPHPDYNPKDHSNDIMLLRLERKANRTKAVRTLKLPKVNAQVKPGHVCRLAGWGLTSFSATRGPADLQEAILIIQEDQKCKSNFHHYSNTTQICAGDPKKTQAAFKGDSGGPLVCDNRAYGIVSFGNTESISSGIFTKVVPFMQWIKRSMKPI
ncbi:granzyme G-like isoform X1 [Cricetulus griseus]|uniref:Granzyme G-like isoform X1 n=1 Tax=Cricetulus griseus TaxID=10029 RepID=A0A9J7HEF1_CRIGR|nr:granzyme G-like isoform X1 [Cricetulus griseus]XP_035311531.1 granzyme G-like isoform X1 [Cricetulus griseus]